MAYGSKTLSRRLATITDAASLAKSLAPQIGELIADDVLPGLEPGEEAPDFGLMVTIIGRALTRVAGRMSELNHRHHHSRALEMRDRAALREAAVALREVLVEVRYLLDRVCGEGASVANFEGRHDLQRIPMVSLERISVGLVALFDDPRFGWQDYHNPTYVTAVRAKLDARIAAFREARRAAGESRSERIHASGESERQLLRLERQAQKMLCLFEGALHGAGFEDAANRLRPKRQRASRRKAAAAPAAP